MSVYNPNWSAVSIPQLPPNLAQSPLHVHKPQSPRLFMPDDPQRQQQQNVPIINTPHGDDDMMDGPPVGRGSAGIPFQGESLNFLLRSALIGVLQVGIWLHQTTTSNRLNSVSEILLRLVFPEQKKTML